jgi:uncharacterized protein YjdB
MRVDTLPAPTITLPTSIVTAAVGDTVRLTATLTGYTGSYEIHWRNRDNWFATTTVPNVAYVKGGGTDSITATMVSIARTCYDSVSSNPERVDSILTVPSMGLMPVICSPNPASNTVLLTWEIVPEKVTVYNATGIIYYTGTPVAKEHTIQLSQWPAGVYYIKSEGYKVIRLVKM